MASVNIGSSNAGDEFYRYKMPALQSKARRAASDGRRKTPCSCSLAPESQNPRDLTACLLCADRGARQRDQDERDEHGGGGQGARPPGVLCVPRPTAAAAFLPRRPRLFGARDAARPRAYVLRRAPQTPPSTLAPSWARKPSSRRRPGWPSSTARTRHTACRSCWRASSSALCSAASATTLKPTSCSPSAKPSSCTARRAVPSRRLTCATSCAPSSSKTRPSSRTRARSARAPHRGRRAPRPQR